MLGQYLRHHRFNQCLPLLFLNKKKIYKKKLQYISYFPRDYYFIIIKTNEKKISYYEVIYLHNMDNFSSVFVTKKINSNVHRCDAEERSHTLVWSSNLLVVRPAARSQRRNVLSHEPERA